MYVYSEGNRVVNGTITSSELSTSQQLVQTYIVILTSNSVLDQVSEKLDRAYTAEELRNMLTASAINNTETFPHFRHQYRPRDGSKNCQHIGRCGT
ncbi:MAG: hypothetical protein RR606_04445, partial [Oscillospiraceae bacterium]